MAAAMSFYSPEEVEGVCFLPTEEELIDCLLMRVTGTTLPCGLEELIHTDDLYGNKEPWHIFGGSEEDKDHRLFFTPLKKLSAKKPTTGIRYVRNVGTGTWTNKGQRKSIYDRAGKVVGYKRCYRYETRKNNKKVDGGGGAAQQIWLLAEYTLPEQVVRSDKVKCKDYAVCVLKKKKMVKKKKNKEDDVVDDLPCVDDVAVAEPPFVGNDDDHEMTTMVLPSPPPPTGDCDHNNIFVDDVALEQIYGNWDFLGNDDIMMMLPPAADLTGDDVADQTPGCWDDVQNNKDDDGDIIGYWRDFLLDNAADDELLPANQRCTDDDLIMSYFNTSDIFLSS